MIGFYSMGLGMVNHMNNLTRRNSVLIERLSSGKRINRAADDPAGLAISQKMQAQIRGLRAAQRNVQDGISLIQTAEGAMNEVHSMLQRMNEIAVESANGTYTDDDRANLNLEFEELKKGINDIVSGTEFNTKKLIDGSQETNGIRIQTGANSGNNLEIKIKNIDIASLSLDTVDISTQANAEDAIAKVKDAVDFVSLQRSSLGAKQNRLEHTLNNLSNYEMNLTASMSRITDTDMARAMMEFTKNQILLQASQAMMAQFMRMEQERMRMLLSSL